VWRADGSCGLGVSKPWQTGPEPWRVDAGLQAAAIHHDSRLPSTGLADNSVGKVIDTLLRNDLIIINGVGFAPLDDTGAQLLFCIIAAAYERCALGIASHWSFGGPGLAPGRVSA
jgi:IstB-like ATP binding protein